jgi:hypothetical protein
MLVRLTRVIRSRFAGLLAVLYLICTLAPAAAFAFGDGSQTAHCLTETGLSAHMHGKGAGAPPHSHADAVPHSHAEGTPADHSHDHDDAGGAAADSNCCGLFCLSSLPAGLVGVAPAAAPASKAIFPAANEIVGSGPDRLYRPPIASLSI